MWQRAHQKADPRAPPAAMQQPHSRQSCTPHTHPAPLVCTTTRASLHLRYITASTDCYPGCQLPLWRALPTLQKHLHNVLLQSFLADSSAEYSALLRQLLQLEEYGEASRHGSLHGEEACAPHVQRVSSQVVCMYDTCAYGVYV